MKGTVSKHHCDFTRGAGQAITWNSRFTKSVFVLLGFCLVKHLSVNREDHTHAAVSCRPWSDKPLNPCGLQSALTTLLTESPESLLLLGEKNPQGIPQIMRSCPSKFKWRTRVLSFRNGQTSGGKERAHSFSLTQKTCVFQGCLPSPAQPEERGRKDHRRNPAELPRHWWFWQFRSKELKMTHSFFSHHSYSLTNTDSPGRNFILYPLWTDILKYPLTNYKNCELKPQNRVYMLREGMMVKITNHSCNGKELYK